MKSYVIKEKEKAKIKEEICNKKCRENKENKKWNEQERKKSIEIFSEEIIEIKKDKIFYSMNWNLN